MRRKTRRLGIGLLALAILYFTAAGIAVRSYWPGLFWSTYLSWLPEYDLVKGPQQTLRERAQYRAAVVVITQRMLTPATAHFCTVSEAGFGADPSGNAVMIGWVDAQNAFGALIRSHFKAVFRKDDQKAVLQVEWFGDAAAERIWM